MDEQLSEKLLGAVGELVGTRPARLVPTERGESGTTFFFESGAEAFVLKVAPAAGPALANQRRLVEVVNGLRRRGYPAPEYLGAGQSGEVAFTVQRRLPGRTLEPGAGRAPEPEIFESVLPGLLSAIDLQADAGDLPTAPWPTYLVDTIERGADGYCRHDTMLSRPDTAELLARVQAVGRRGGGGPVRTADVMHFDMNPANVLQVNRELSGVIDWNVPFAGAAQGDRGFDLATLFFYTYDLPRTRELLWQRLIDVSGAGWASVYLAHLCLRQVEWSLRVRPGSEELARFLGIATAVMDRCGR